MTKEENYSPEEEKKESVLDFEEAKEMTVGQATRKKEELEAGVNESDNVLDKYIKQHRQEIEAGKFETQKIRKLQEQEAAQAEQASSDLTDFIKERRQEVESEQEIPTAQLTATETASEPEAVPTPLTPLGSRSQRSEQEDAVPAAPVQRHLTVLFQNHLMRRNYRFLRHLSTRKSFPLSSFRTFRDCCSGHRALLCSGA